MKYTKEDKQAIIEIIEWYRDEHHKKDYGHTEMIKTINTTTEEYDIELIERTLDEWADH